MKAKRAGGWEVRSKKIVGVDGGVEVDRYVSTASRANRRVAQLLARQREESAKKTIADGAGGVRFVESKGRRSGKVEVDK